LEAVVPQGIQPGGLIPELAQFGGNFLDVVLGQTPPEAMVGNPNPQG
jgi:hypothetical protein